MLIQSLKVSEKAKQQLTTLKRYTGIKNWNVLCRWAFCTSLAAPTKPAAADIPADSNVEMSWKVFGGPQQEVYEALLKARCKNDGIPMEPAELNRQFRLHIHRGIGYLSGTAHEKGLSGLLKTTIGP